jgi:hypothetical protein
MKPIDDTHITIQGWMRTALNLKGERLQAFALVYGFSQDGESQFYGSLKYVMEWLGCSKPTAIAILDYLTNLHLITKHTGKAGIESNRYTVNAIVVDALRQERARAVKELNRGGKESLPVVVKKFNHSGKESLPVVVKKFNHRGKESLPDNYNYNDKDTDNNKESAPAQFIVKTIALETIPTVECEVPRPAARPASKVSELQKNINAHSEAAEHFLRLLQAKGHSLNGAEKYTAAYFLNEQRKGRWASLLIPADAGEEHRWLGEHSPGIIQWAQRQPQFERNNGAQPTPQAAVAPTMRLSNPENAPR